MGMGGNYTYVRYVYIDIAGVETGSGYSIGDGPVLTMCYGAGQEDGIPTYPCERYLSADHVAAEQVAWSTVKSLYR